MRRDAAQNNDHDWSGFSSCARVLRLALLHLIPTAVPILQPPCGVLCSRCLFACMRDLSHSGARASKSFPAKPFHRSLQTDGCHAYQQGESDFREGHRRSRLCCRGAVRRGAVDIARESGPIATDASIYGYSRNTTQVTLVQTSNVPKAASLRGPPSQFVNVPRRGGAAFRDD